MAEAIALQRGPASDRFFTSDVAIRTEAAWQRVRRVIPPFEWPLLAPDVDAIQRLKRERNAVVLAPHYQTPEIYNGVADIVADSLALARDATTVDPDVIVLCAAHFMTEPRSTEHTSDLPPL